MAHVFRFTALRDGDLEIDCVDWKFSRGLETVRRPAAAAWREIPVAGLAGYGRFSRQNLRMLRDALAHRRSRLRIRGAPGRAL